MKRAQLVTSTDYHRPFRRVPVRLLNGALTKIPALLPKLSEAAVLEAARKQADLEDFGDEWFREALRVLLASMRDEARLNPLGHVIQHGRVVAALVTRLRTQALLRANPEIEAQVLGKMVVIAGLQRTGTTTLHRLLAADPRARSLASWEALNPVPVPGEANDPRGRQRQARLAEKGLAYLAPEFFAIHPVEHLAPEEDVLLLDLSFMSQAPEAILHVPTYAAWLENQDHQPAYEELRTMLKLLQWQRGAGHWVLKTPHHMEHLDSLCEVFPEAKIVQTHRDPRKTMGSFCSMVAHGRGVFSDSVDAHEVAEHWVRKVRRMMARSIEVRDSLGQARFLDVAYPDLLADPVGEVRRIYDFAGLSWDEGVASAVEEVRSRNTQNRFGRHVYRLADFGLSEARIEAEFGFYRERYGIEKEKGSVNSKAPTDDDATHLGHSNPVTATITGILDLFSKKGFLEPLPDDARIDGKLCLITGANSGLGKATAIHLAKRGARLILACRSGIPEAGEDIVRLSGNPDVEMMQVDLSDLASVHRLCDGLKARGEPLDLIVLNAGLMPRKAIKTAQGYEVMFAVHFLANRTMMQRWVDDGLLVPGGAEGREVPRVIFITSETHKSSDPIDFGSFGEVVDYGITDGMACYGASKLHMSTLAEELSRRFNPDGDAVQVAVHHLCPGPINSNISRDAPGFIKPILGPVMGLFFNSPEDAAEPVVYLACSPKVEGRTGIYMHLMREKDPSPLARDAKAGAALWEMSAGLIVDPR